MAADLIPRLAAMGHDVAISANALVTSHMSSWRGHVVYPCTPYDDVGEDVVLGHYRDFKADLCVTLMCTWVLKIHQPWRDMRTIHVTPVDCMPMSAQDYRAIWLTGGLPAAVSRFGMEAMRARGLDPVYLPHVVDTGLFRPPADRDGLREAIGVGGKFVVGLNFMNNDRARKAIFEQFKAFATLHLGDKERGLPPHPDTVLAVHAIKVLPEGLHLPQLAEHLGLKDMAVAGRDGAVMYSPQYRLVTGQIPAQAMADWYGACDVVSNVGNEGFGLPLIEAQACGTPVVAGGWGTGPELTAPRAGWRVKGQAEWNRVHAAEWRTPLITDLERKYEAAHRELTYSPELAAAYRSKVRAFAMRWDADKVIPATWGPVLHDIN